MKHNNIISNPHHNHHKDYTLHNSIDHPISQSHNLPKGSRYQGCLLCCCPMSPFIKSQSLLNFPQYNQLIISVYQSVDILFLGLVRL